MTKGKSLSLVDFQLIVFLLNTIIIPSAAMSDQQPVDVADLDVSQVSVKVEDRRAG